jgi:hypothetical protein
LEIRDRRLEISGEGRDFGLQISKCRMGCGTKRKTGMFEKIRQTGMSVLLGFGV